MRKFVLIMALAVMLLPGCVQQPQPSRSVYKRDTYTVDDSRASYSDKYVDVKLTPVMTNYAYRSFKLSIQNKTKSDIKLSWNESYYLENGEGKEGFMFEGIVFEKRTEPKQDLLLLPGSTITKEISPTIKAVYIPPDLTAMRMGLPAGWVHGVMENGEFGAYLKFTGAGYQKQVKLLTKIDVQ